MKTRLLIPLLTLACLLAMPATAQVNYAVSTLNPGTAYVDLSYNASGNIVIASTYSGFPVTRIDTYAFLQCSNLTSVSIPNSINSIGQMAFYQCAGLTNVTIGNSVASIGLYTFAYCAKLTGVTIPASVTTIGSASYPAFLSCTGLTNFAVAAANPAYSSINGVLFNKAQTTLIQFPGGRGGGYVIPNSVTNIEIAAFSDCLSLSSVTISNSVTSIGSGAFRRCPGLTNITVAAANPAYSSLNGVLFNKAQTTLLQFPGGRGGSYVVSNSVTSIGSGAFSSSASLTNITVAVDNPAYSSIDGVLFNKAQTTLIQFPGGRGGGYVIPNSVTSIGSFAFYACASLTNLTFLGNRPSLGAFVFDFVADGATVYYYYATTGWGPTYGGLPTVMLGAPAPQIGTGTAGVKSGGFGFTITGVTNQTIVVEASTNLANWQPIWTNTLSAASTNFVDPQWLNHPRRFYRARSN